MDHFLTQPLQGYRIGQRFAAALKGKRYRGVADAEALTVDGAHGNSPVLGIHSSQLRYVRGDLAFGICLTFPIEILDMLRKARPVGNYKLVPERSRNQDDIGIYDPVTIVESDNDLHRKAHRAF